MGVMSRTSVLKKDICPVFLFLKASKMLEKLPLQKGVNRCFLDG